MPEGCYARVGYLIPAEQKAEYINSLLKVGFDTIDFGSFVLPKTISLLAIQNN
jgi:hydroxymethylglutaryl-CoA lyase